MREFGSEFEIEYARDHYFDDLCKLKENSAFTRSGREAIGLAALAVEKGVVLMPAYCCWSMEMPFEKAGFKVEYYRLNKDLSVDKDFLCEQIRIFSPKVVLVMNYFGFVPTDDIVSFIKGINENITIVEDFTQSLFSLRDNFNPLIDVYVASIRKSIGVPDGGIIITSLSIDSSLLKDGSETLFVSEHIKAGRKKMCYQYTANVEDKTMFREKQAVAGKDIKENYGLYKISDEALSIVKHTIVDNVRVARYNNYKNLYDKIKNIDCLEVLFVPAECNKAPFSMIVCAENRDAVQSAMAKYGVYAQVLWPLKEKAKEICSVSKYMEENMLAIPIDQRYDFYDIAEMGEQIIKALK